MQKLDSIPILMLFNLCRALTMLNSIKKSCHFHHRFQFFKATYVPLHIAEGVLKHVDKAFCARKSWLQELTYSAINRISQALSLHGLESRPRINWPLLCKVGSLEQEIYIEKCNEWLRKHFTIAQSLAGWITEIYLFSNFSWTLPKFLHVSALCCLIL